jgi:hypothetical protein
MQFTLFFVFGGQFELRPFCSVMIVTKLPCVGCAFSRLVLAAITEDDVAAKERAKARVKAVFFNMVVSFFLFLKLRGVIEDIKIPLLF